MAFEKFDAEDLLPLWPAVQQRMLLNQNHPRNIYVHGPLVGSLGEIAFEHWCSDAGLTVAHVGRPEWDYERQCADGAVCRIEVKTKLRTTWSDANSRNWEMSVPDYLPDAWKRDVSPDVFVAVSVQSSAPSPASVSDVSSVVLIGAMTFRRWRGKMRYVAEGTIMGGGRPSKVGMYNVYLKDFLALDQFDWCSK